jgi:DNA repair exonuclease SbcCD ATPase subunit
MFFARSIPALVGLAALCLAAPCPAAESRPDAAQVRAQAEKAVEVRARAQDQAERLAAKEQELLDAVEARRQELEVLRRQRAKVEAYLADQREDLAELRRREQEFRRIRAELEPWLDRTRRRLAGFVEGDLPFLAQERAQRLERLGETLDDYDAGLPEKARRTFGALEIEARYGATVDARERELEIAGALMRARLLRVGRLALFALSPEGDRAWRWEPRRGFVLLDGWSRELQQAAEIAQRQRVAGLVQVPVGKAPPLARPAPEGGR